MKGDFASWIDLAPWPAMLVNLHGTILWANACAQKLFGPITRGTSELAATVWGSENPVEAEEFLAQPIRQYPTTAQLKLRTKTAPNEPFQVLLCPIQHDGQVLRLLQFCPPLPPPAPATPLLPPRSASEAQTVGMMHKQKLDCAMQLTRSVSLDFKNFLTCILGHVSLTLSKTDPDNPWRSSLLEIEKAAEKAAEIAANLSAFSGQEADTQAQSESNLNELTRRCTALFQTPNHASIQWSLELDAQIYQVRMDEAKMQQAFVKILENAVQAMPEGGTITVRTRNLQIAEPVQDGTTQVPPGQYVCAEFVDTGVGIPTEILPRVFEPFFTTKNSPDHRGLGLAWVYGIMTNHGGCVALASTVAQGTSVRLYLPALPALVDDAILADEDLTGCATILFIDDEELLLTMSQEILGAYGYRVITASNGMFGVEVFTANAAQIDLVITDLVMPQMSGREVIENIRKLSSTVPIICSSGYSRALRAEDKEPILEKPFTSQDLLRKVKEVLRPPREHKLT